MKYWFIGYDPRDDLASKVAIRSMRAHTSEDVRVVLLKDYELRRCGFYWRPYEVLNNGQMIDYHDGKPFSTQFSFARFCALEVARSMGITDPILFTDGDVMFRSDIKDMFAEWQDDKAVMCVQHDHRPAEAKKFDDLEQTKYFRKNWSSVMLMDPLKNESLTLQKVNNQSGSMLHGLLWLKDPEIGALSPCWNHLIGYDAGTEAKLAHFTLGTPDMPGCAHREYSEEWLSYCEPGELDPLPFYVAPPSEKIRMGRGGR